LQNAPVTNPAFPHFAKQVAGLLLGYSLSHLLFQRTSFLFIYAGKEKKQKKECIVVCDSVHFIFCLRKICFVKFVILDSISI